MRLKEFLIVLAVFTVVYFGFFGIIDLILGEKSNNKYKNNLKSMLTIDNYKKFARFYGIESNLTFDVIININSIFSGISYPAKISEIAASLGISHYELIVVYLFFEYLGLLPKKTFMFDTDTISNTNMIDLNLVNKYNHFFIEKKPLDQIVKMTGGNTINDLIHLNQLFLVPGVRFINNQLYYVGDMDEGN